MNENLGGPDYYAFERGTGTCESSGNCSGETRSTNIIQRIGLIYPSDFIYTYAYGVDDVCYSDGNNCKANSGAVPKNSWLYNKTNQWTLSPYSANSMLIMLSSQQYIFHLMLKSLMEMEANRTLTS